jgi:hypothetical protein
MVQAALPIWSEFPPRMTLLNNRGRLPIVYLESKYCGCRTIVDGHVTVAMNYCRPTRPTKSFGQTFLKVRYRLLRSISC